jgi:4a-hydroxytetrahydrobiopterin dehydratase
MTEDLTKKKCVPCEGGVIPFDISEIHIYQRKVDGWDILKNEKKNFTYTKDMCLKIF